MSRMSSVLYGVGYLVKRVNCIERLRQMRLSYPPTYPLGFAKNARGALNVRRRQDIRAMTDTLRVRAKVERPTLQQLQAVGMTVVATTGRALYRRPVAFGMIAPDGFFVSEIPRKLNDAKELHGWSYYHSSNQRRPSRVSGFPHGGPAEEVAALPGPNLAPAERRADSANAPTNAGGAKLRWNSNSHLGCSDQACQRAPEYTGCARKNDSFWCTRKNGPPQMLRYAWALGFLNSENIRFYPHAV